MAYRRWGSGKLALTNTTPWPPINRSHIASQKVINIFSVKDRSPAKSGSGEAIIRVVLARRALDYLKEADDPHYAAKVAVDLLVEEGRGEGGLILVDWRGRVGHAQSTLLMPVAWMSPALDAPHVGF